MSFGDKFNDIKRKFGSKSRVGVTIAALAAIAAVVLVPGTGANFTASDTGRMDMETASLALSLTDDGGSVGTFDLDFPNVAPGQSVSRNFYVQNTGTIPANVKIGQPVSGQTLVVPPGQTPNFGQLKVGINNYLSMTAVTALPPSINLGQLAPGQQAGYTVVVGLDQSADNNWQNVTAGGNVTVTLEQ